jgi:uncharacterized protein YdaU (DUF1376 family)
MAEFPALPLFVDSYMADCKHLGDAEHGRYLLLLFEMWMAPGGRLPNDDAWLARRLQRTIPEIVSDFRPLIREFCRIRAGWIYQKRLEKERRWVSEKRKKNARAANIRHGNEK